MSDQCYTWFQLWLSALNYRQTFALDSSNEDNSRYLVKDFGRRKGHTGWLWKVLRECQLVVSEVYMYQCLRAAQFAADWLT